MLREQSEKEKYRKFFNDTMDKFGINSPADLSSDSQKKKFFDYIDKHWTGSKVEEENARESIVSEANAFLKARAVAMWEDKEEFEFNGKIYPVIKIQQEIKSVNKSDLDPSSLKKLKVKMAGVNKVTAKDPLYDTITNIINGANHYELQDIVDAEVNILSHAANLYLKNPKKYADIVAYGKDLTKE